MGVPQRKQPFRSSSFCGLFLTVDLFFNKPFTNEVPYCLSQDRYFRNMLFETCHNMNNSYIGRLDGEFHVNHNLNFLSLVTFYICSDPESCGQIRN
jgi:hypothetical protein